ncbi:hypothetical protein Scep_025752 [Stephania cephalantha]|uniref:Uncharacterized protein n=1 Tax=Stephania cephalantha TaxID=152367 RepID=A0AAP0ER38_9MAGN
MAAKRGGSRPSSRSRMTAATDARRSSGHGWWLIGDVRRASRGAAASQKEAGAQGVLAAQWRMADSGGADGGLWTTASRGRKQWRGTEMEQPAARCVCGLAWQLSAAMAAPAMRSSGGSSNDADKRQEWRRAASAAMTAVPGAVDIPHSRHFRYGDAASDDRFEMIDEGNREELLNLLALERKQRELLEIMIAGLEENLNRVLEILQAHVA